jgi:hypothetical protein
MHSPRGCAVIQIVLRSGIKFEEASPIDQWESAPSMGSPRADPSFPALN